MHKKKTHSALFKYEVSVAAIKGEQTQAQISSKYEIHSTQITKYDNVRETIENNLTSPLEDIRNEAKELLELIKYD